MITKDEKKWSYVGVDLVANSDVPALVFKRKVDDKHKIEQYDYVCGDVKLYCLNGTFKIYHYPIGDLALVRES